MSANYKHMGVISSKCTGWGEGRKRGTVGFGSQHLRICQTPSIWYSERCCAVSAVLSGSPATASLTVPSRTFRSHVSFFRSTLATRKPVFSPPICRNGAWKRDPRGTEVSGHLCSWPPHPGRRAGWLVRSRNILQERLGH